ncbi:MAG: hypothetical protein IPO81_10295 [Kouleothrix sp.]|nr:hypothetical protein [Kouleothrix sp.]
MIEGRTYGKADLGIRRGLIAGGLAVGTMISLIFDDKHGTQYVHDGVRHRLWDVDPATTDAERAAWNVPTLAEQLRKAEEATRVDPPQPISLDDAPWWLKEALLRWKRGESAAEA